MEAATMDELRRTDPEIARAIAQDTERQRYHVNLIASENYASRAVLEALGTPMSNKYAEGYPGKRYYGGCEFVDTSEQLAIDRAKALFGAEHANVQPHAGAQANMAAYFAFLKPGDPILAMNLAHGAGLVAGKAHPDPVPYADVVTSTTHKTLRGPRGGLILCRAAHAAQIDKAVFPGTQGGPLEHCIAAKAVCFLEASRPAFRTYAARIVENARAMAEAFLAAGYHVVSGGTDNHLVLLDVRARALTGRKAEKALDGAHIIVDKNMIPFDPEKPMTTSGIRIGTPAMTTRGMGPGEMRRIAAWIDEVLRAPEDAAAAERVRRQVRD